MDVTPKLLVEDKEFSRALKGYNCDEVDEFLELVAVALAKLQGQLAESDERARVAEERVQELESRPAAEAEADDIAEEARRTLALAQRTATDAVREAREEAARVVAAAEEYAENLLAEAEREARRQTEEGRSEAVHEVRSLEHARDELRGDIALLEQYLEHQRQTLGRAVEELQHLLDRPGGLRLGDLPELAAPGVTRPDLVEPAASEVEVDAEELDAEELDAEEVRVQADGDDQPEAAVAVDDVVDLTDSAVDAAPGQPEAVAADDEPEAVDDAEVVGDAEAVDDAEVVGEPRPEPESALQADARPESVSEPEAEPLVAAESPGPDVEPDAAPADDGGPPTQPLAALTIDADPADRTGSTEASPDEASDPPEGAAGTDSAAADDAPVRVDGVLHARRPSDGLGVDADEDAFLAELRKAMNDEEPLGPRDDIVLPPLDDAPTGERPRRGRSRFGRRR